MIISCPKLGDDSALPTVSMPSASALPGGVDELKKAQAALLALKAQQAAAAAASPFPPGSLLLVGLIFAGVVVATLLAPTKS